MDLKPANRIFILSSANCAGIRAQLLMAERSSFPLAKQLGEGGASLGAIFSFMSALYFRGKLAYASRFANPPLDLPGTLIVTPGSGLRAPEEILTAVLVHLQANRSADDKKQHAEFLTGLVAILRPQQILHRD